MVDTEFTASAGTAGTAQLAVEMRGIYKSFDTTSVLRDVGFEVAKGEVHGVRARGASAATGQYRNLAELPRTSGPSHPAGLLR